MGIVQKLFILKFEPDLDPEPEKLCEHGAWGNLEIQQNRSDKKISIHNFKEAYSTQ